MSNSKLNTNYINWLNEVKYTIRPQPEDELKHIRNNPLSQEFEKRESNE